MAICLRCFQKVKRRNAHKIGKTWVHKNCNMENVKAANWIRWLPKASDENSKKIMEKLRASNSDVAKAFLKILDEGFKEEVLKNEGN